MVDLLGLAIQIVKWLVIVAFALALIAAVVTFTWGQAASTEGVSVIREPEYGQADAYPVAVAKLAIDEVCGATYISGVQLFAAFVTMCVSAAFALAGWRVSRWFTN